MCPANESRVNMEGQEGEKEEESYYYPICGEVITAVTRTRTRSDGEKEGLFGGVSSRLPFTQVAEDLKSLGKIVFPVTTTTLLLHSKSVISMLFLGHLGNAALAGGSLAMSFANVTGFSVIKGLSMGMEPICCQAYGAKKLTVISQTFQRTLCMLLLAAIGISLLWLNMEPILLLLGQDRDIVNVGKIYLTFSIPELIAQVHLHPLRSFLRTQCITKPLTISTMVCLAFHLPINYFLVVYLELGVKGVALASACNTINLDLCILIYLFFSKKMEVKPWDGMTFVTPFQGWRVVLSLALPSVLSVCLEWWWYEIMLFLCGLLRNPKSSIAAMGILIQTTGLLYVFPYALSTGISTRVGHELGAGQPNGAKRTATLGLVLGLLLGLSAFTFTVLVRSVWGKMYTSENDVLALVSVALPVLGFCEIGNCPQTAACGVLTGSARTQLGAKINFVAFYVVGLPVAVVVGFVFRVGFVGLWLGLAAAQAACVGMMVFVVVRTDWKDQAKRSEDLTRRSSDGRDELETGLLS